MFDQRFPEEPPTEESIQVSVVNQGFTETFVLPSTLPVTATVSAPSVAYDQSFFRFDASALPAGTILDVELLADTTAPNAGQGIVDLVAMAGPDLSYGRYFDGAGYYLPGSLLPFFAPGVPERGRTVFRAEETVTLLLQNQLRGGTGVNIEAFISEVSPVAEAEPNDGTAQDLGELGQEAVAVEGSLAPAGGMADVDRFQIQVVDGPRPLRIRVVPEGAQDIQVEWVDPTSGMVLIANDDAWELDRAAVLELSDLNLTGDAPNATYELRVSSPVPGDAGAYLLTIH